MKTNLLISFAIFSLIFVSCDGTGPLSYEGDFSATGKSGETGTGESQPGLVTAGEWNDLDNWMFLDSLVHSPNLAENIDYWGFYRNHRIAIQVTDASNNPVIDVKLVLKRNGTEIWSAKSDNLGRAELWVDLFQKSAEIDTTQLQLIVGNLIISPVKTFAAGVNNVILSGTSATSTNVDLAFMVDATGSMSDELEFLKTELLDVINRAKSDNPTANMQTGSVFYRDKGDDYLTRVSNFTTNIQTTINFIKNQQASGGGDFPEAVHTALDKSINELQWSSTARTRILFMILDAPPHYETDIISQIQSLVKKSAESGIKIIPITASGIDKSTEFLMRFMAISTNGTYVFITNDSGVGNEHLEPTVGYYQVEKLNDLMVRLINKYVR